jgi:hypothetical protein
MQSSRLRHELARATVSLTTGTSPNLSSYKVSHPTYVITAHRYNGLQIQQSGAISQKSRTHHVLAITKGMSLKYVVSLIAPRNANYSILLLLSLRLKPTLTSPSAILTMMIMMMMMKTTTTMVYLKTLNLQEMV